MGKSRAEGKRTAEGKQQRGRATENKSSRGEKQQSGKSICGKR
ncbi:MAG: hypothetical protein SPH62_06050 [Candidatus Egerieousia sp.]|nr:hypothetical protein [bacterium]MDY5255946.1 hypothetical protein [Candidatus Egerieousia sp.]